MEDKIVLSKRKILKHTFYENAIWMALRSEDENEVLKYFRLKDYKTMHWDDAFEFESHNAIIVTPSILGWVFITGYYLLDIFPPLETAGYAVINQYEHQEIFSLKFNDVQIYMNSGKYGVQYFTKAVNGKFEYSWSYTELGIEEEGIRPIELDQNCDVFDIGEVAGIWSLNPCFFPYYESLKHAEVFVYYMPAKSIEERWYG